LYFLAKGYQPKSARKMLMKLSPEVNQSRRNFVIHTELNLRSTFMLYTLRNKDHLTQKLLIEFDEIDP